MTTKQPQRRALWLDAIRAFAMLWVFVNHIAEKVFASGPYFANPRAGWPDLDARLDQIEPLSEGVMGVLWNPLRYFGWVGDTGVQLFLIGTGFVLTSSLIRADEPKTEGFLSKRLRRLFPSYWLAIGFFMVITLALYLLGFGPDSYYVLPWKREFWFSLIGLRVDTDTIYWGAPSWWYIGLLVQLYLIFPLLWRGLRKLGPTRFLLLVGGGAIAVRLAGLLLLDQYWDTYLDAWSRGAVVLTRLPEIVFGMALAWWAYYRPEGADIVFRTPAAYFGLLLFVDGFVASFYLAGNALSPSLLGIGAFLMLTRIFRDFEGTSIVGMGWKWLGEHSLAVFLVHHHMIRFLVPTGTDSLLKFLLGLVLATAATLGAAVLLERAADVCTDVWEEWGSVGVERRFGGAIVAGLLLFFGLLVGASVLSRSIERNEVAGWGERPSLVADETVGWHLKPSSQTNLRWMGYDYNVTGNNLGFPGPDIALEAAPDDTYRIWVTGDAFSSAEGVDTDQSWPRLLETMLDQSDRPVDVVNFSITGWGPNQQVAALEQYGAELAPDLIVVQAFVNDFGDAVLTNEEFEALIGLGDRGPNHPLSLIELRDLRAVLKNQVDDVRERIEDRPNPIGYHFGNFEWFEVDALTSDGPEVAAVRSAYAELQALATELDAELVVVLVPASIQVCNSAALNYFPAPFELTDDRWDLSQPQRAMADITSDLGIEFVDAQPALDDGVCVYQPDNMHLLPEGHEMLANAVAISLAETTESLSS